MGHCLKSNQSKGLWKAKNELSEVPQVWKVSICGNFQRASKLEGNTRGPVANVIDLFSFVWIRNFWQHQQINKQQQTQVNKPKESFFFGYWITGKFQSLDIRIIFWIFSLKHLLTLLPTALLQEQRHSLTDVSIFSDNDDLLSLPCACLFSFPRLASLYVTCLSLFQCPSHHSSFLFDSIDPSRILPLFHCL